MTRLLSNITVVALAAFTFGAAVAAYAQTPAPANCGVETWSTDKMTYVTTPCAGGQEQAAGQSTKAPESCGPETWSTDKMTYVGAPCSAGTTYENPTGKSSENFNNK